MAVEGKTVYASLTVIGDTLEEIARRRPTSAIIKIFYAAKIRIQFRFRPVTLLRLKASDSLSITSACLNTGTIKSLNIAVVSHPAQTDHTVNVTQAFVDQHKIRINSLNW